MKYPKINTLWKRDQLSGQIQVGEYALPEFQNIKKWLVQEKIDGTNIRINYKCKDKEAYGTYFYGRTEQATIPKPLKKHLEDTFLRGNSLWHYFTKTGTELHAQDIWLFGEGYGPKIQKGGGNYRDEVGFILFDVWANGWWLNQDSVKSMAQDLNIPYAPIIGEMTEQEIIEYIKSEPNSTCAVSEHKMEGIVAKAEPLLLQCNGDPLRMKLKARDYQKLNSLIK